MASFSFGSEKRLTKRSDYLRFYKGAQRWRGQSFSVFRIPNSEGVFRFGMTIKTKGGGIVRNRTRRKIRELVRTHQHQLQGYDYNFVLFQLGESVMTEAQNVFRAGNLFESRSWN